MAAVEIGAGAEQECRGNQKDGRLGAHGRALSGSGATAGVNAGLLLCVRRLRAAVEVSDELVWGAHPPCVSDKLP